MIGVSARRIITPHHRYKSRVYILFFGLLIVIAVGVILGYKSYRRSLFGDPSARINIALWGEHSYVISLGKESRQHYILAFGNSYAVEVPGGLKNYHIGALGRLSSLEKDPKIYTKAMGQGSGVLIYRTIHAPTETVYYDDAWLDSLQTSTVKSEILRRMITQPGDAGIFDRIYVIWALQSAKESQIKIVTLKENEPGLLLYDKTFRQEKKLVQIQYRSSQHTAYRLSRLLENTGIRIADISHADTTPTECVVYEPDKRPSHTAQFVSRYFGCLYESRDTGLYDTVWVLNSRVEKEWEL